MSLLSCATQTNKFYLKIHANEDLEEPYPGVFNYFLINQTISEKQSLYKAYILTNVKRSDPEFIGLGLDAHSVFFIKHATLNFIGWCILSWYSLRSETPAALEILIAPVKMEMWSAWGSPKRF